MLAALAISLAAAASPNPCHDASLHLRCPNLIMRKPGDLHLLGGTRRQLLASTNAIINIGAGPLEVRGRRTSSKEMFARQVIRGDGPTHPAVVLKHAGEIYFKNVPTRGGFYWKYEDAARFELWHINGAGRRTDRARVGPKIYYCLRDLFHVRPYGRRSLRYPSCAHPGSIGQVTLGISRGWADRYPSTYPANWIDVTGLKGCFAYVHIADPKNHLRETDETDNQSLVTVRLPFRGPGRHGCPEAKLAKVPPPA